MSRTFYILKEGSAKLIILKLHDIALHLLPISITSEIHGVKTQVPGPQHLKILMRLDCHTCGIHGFSYQSMFVWVSEYLSEQTKQIHTPVTNSPPNTLTAETTKIKGRVGNRSKQLKGTNFTEILGKV